MRIDQYTRHLEILLMKIAQSAKENGKDYFIGGGLAIDLSLGKMSRNHHDIDFHPMLEDASWWIKWFKDKGYEVKNRQDPEFPETWNVFNSNNEAIIDMWPLRLESETSLINHNGEYTDSGRHWEETKLVKYKDVDIKIENPERVLEQKTRHVKQGQEYRLVDLHDFKLLGREPE